MSTIQAPVMIKADAIPEKSALDRELKPSADNPEDSDESDLDDRLARKRYNITAISLMIVPFAS